MWYVCHGAREMRIYFPEMQIQNRAAQDTQNCAVRSTIAGLERSCKEYVAWG